MHQLGKVKGLDLIVNLERKYNLNLCCRFRTENRFCVVVLICYDLLYQVSNFSDVFQPHPIRIYWYSSLNVFYHLFLISVPCKYLFLAIEAVISLHDHCSADSICSSCSLLADWVFHGSYLSAFLSSFTSIPTTSSLAELLISGPCSQHSYP